MINSRAVLCKHLLNMSIWGKIYHRIQEVTKRRVYLWVTELSFSIPIPLILSQTLRFIFHHPGLKLLIYTLILVKKKLLIDAKDTYWAAYVLLLHLLYSTCIKHIGDHIVCQSLSSAGSFLWLYPTTSWKSSHGKRVLGHLLWRSWKLVSAFLIPLLKIVFVQWLRMVLLCLPPSPAHTVPPTAVEHMLLAVMTPIWCMDQVMAVFLLAVYVSTACNKACVVWIIEQCWC